MPIRRPTFDTILSLRATLERMERQVSAEGYAEIKCRVLRRIAELELKQAIAEQTRTPPLVPAASIDMPPPTEAASRKKSVA